MGLNQYEIEARERKIIDLRSEYTLKQIGEMFELTRERIRQIEMRGRRRIARRKMIEDKGPITVESDIERLNISIRLYISLRRSGINTIGNIIESGSPFQLLKIKGLGYKGIKEIIEEMNRIGFHLSKYAKFKGVK